MFLTAYFALRNQLQQRPGEQFTVQQAHELWNPPWPGMQQPLYLTEKALEALEREGVVACSYFDSNSPKWRAHS